MNVLDRVRRTIRDHGLMTPATRVVAAVSGGSDSMALAHLLRELERAGEVQLAGIAHFNHQLRASAATDEHFVVDACAALGCPVLVDREDVAARASRERRSLEDAARAARYAFLERARAHFNGDVVALGHTRDDQAETVLLRLIRGAGPRGLAAMYPRNGSIVRPLLDCRREDLRSWIADRGVGFVEDETNLDVAIPRNRVRAELIPLLESRFNASIVDVLANEAELAREAWEFLSEGADETAARIVKATEDGYVLDVPALRGLPSALRRAVMWRVMSRVAGTRTVDFARVSDALRLLDPDGPSSADGPGQRLERIGERLVLTGRPATATGRATRARHLFRYPLSIPGEVELAEAGCLVSAEPVAASLGDDDIRATVGNGSTAFVRADLCGQGLAVRNRRPGDRFRPLGLGGRKKLQDFFVDRKVRRAERDRVPLVVDRDDRIVWVAGFGIDEAFRVTAPGQAMLVLRLSQARPVRDRA